MLESCTILLVQLCWQFKSAIKKMQITLQHYQHFMFLKFKKTVSSALFLTRMIILLNTGQLIILLIRTVLNVVLSLLVETHGPHG